MRFVRQLAAAVTVVAVIVGLGLLWAHVSGGGTGAGSVSRQVPHQVMLRMERIKTGAIAGHHGGDGLRLTNTQDLVRTCVIEAGLAAVVIMASAVQRQRRRMRRDGAGLE